MKQIWVTENRVAPWVLIGCLIAAVFVGLLTFRFGLIFPILAIGVTLFAFVCCIFLNKPKLTLFVLITYCFCFGILGREVNVGIPYGVLIEGLLLISWVVVVVKAYRKEVDDMNNDLTWLLIMWFLISIMEVANPSGADLEGWLQELRSAALYPMLIVPLTFILFNSKVDLDRFLIIVIGLSVLAALNGIKQLHIGLSPGEQAFLDGGGRITHVLWGQLRVFSFYSDAGQFGASQAHIGLVSLVLAMGPFKWWKRVLLFIAAALLFYGMLISGTRGALFALVVGAFMAIVLSKQFKVLFVGGLLLVAFLGFLKFTYIGNSNYQIYRLRSALNPEDPSLNVRFNTQALLNDYLSDKPFGDGLGVIGANGNKYNSDMFISTVQPDSYFVKIWVMYGVVGLAVWLGIMLYILGKCCGIVWHMRDRGLQIKLIALTAGYAGILFCSYGNEVINTMPSSIIVYISWALIFKGPRFDSKSENRDEPQLTGHIIRKSHAV